MSKAFKHGPSIERDIHETLLSILAAADQTYLSGVDLAQFEKGLIDEVHFLVPCDEEEMRQIEHYVYQHSSELYQAALAGTLRRKGGTDL
jgi:hypothetical protein